MSMVPDNILYRALKLRITLNNQSSTIILPFIYSDPATIFRPAPHPTPDGTIALSSTHPRSKQA
jgi:hypothetical protein